MDYRKHFALTGIPFQRDIPVDELFKSADQVEMAARMRHLLAHNGMGLFTGEPGTGKTTVCRMVTATLHTAQHRVLYVPNSTGNVPDLYKTIAWELGVQPERSRAALYRAIKAQVAHMATESRIITLLIVDEAHLLRDDVLEELRLLTNHDMDSRERLRIIFVGQPELRRRLSMSVHEALQQRITIRHQLTGLTRKETGEYLLHHMRQVGAMAPLFEEAAAEAIHVATHGLQRPISVLAHHALLGAARANARTVGPDHVAQATAECS